MRFSSASLALLAFGITAFSYAQTSVTSVELLPMPCAEPIT
jgi:hypothetical protein